VLADVETKMAQGIADPSALWALFTFIGDEAARAQPDWADKVQEYIRQLSPDTMRAELERRVSDAEAHAKDAIAEAKEQAIEWTSRAITSLLAGNDLPHWLIEARPELADITLAKRAVSRGKAAGNVAAIMPKSRADALRFFLQSQGITPAKHRGIWITSSDISLLNGGANMPETPTELAKILGNNTKDGTAYIAPLEKVMERLLAYHCVPELLAKQWANLPQSGGDSDDKGAVIPFGRSAQSAG